MIPLSRHSHLLRHRDRGRAGGGGKVGRGGRERERERQRETDRERGREGERGREREGERAREREQEREGESKSGESRREMLEATGYLSRYNGVSYEKTSVNFPSDLQQSITQSSHSADL